MLLRDLGRFGEMMRNNGRANGQQVLPEAAVAANAGNDPVTLPAYLAVAKELMKEDARGNDDN